VAQHIEDPARNLGAPTVDIGTIHGVTDHSSEMEDAGTDLSASTPNLSKLHFTYPEVSPQDIGKEH
jgi:hypothetical protein